MNQNQRLAALLLSIGAIVLGISQFLIAYDVNQRLDKLEARQQLIEQQLQRSAGR